MTITLCSRFCLFFESRIITKSNGFIREILLDLEPSWANCWKRDFTKKMTFLHSFLSLQIHSALSWRHKALGLLMFPTALTSIHSIPSMQFNPDESMRFSRHGSQNHGEHQTCSFWLSFKLTHGWMVTELAFRKVMQGNQMSLCWLQPVIFSSVASRAKL